MQIHVKKTKEATKGMLSGSNWNLSMIIKVDLNEAEKELVAKYGDPTINALCAQASSYIRFYYDGQDEAYKVVKVQQDKSNLSEFRLAASVKGHDYIGNMQNFEEATIRALNYALNHLKSLDTWDGVTTIETE